MAVINISSYSVSENVANPCNEFDLSIIFQWDTREAPQETFIQLIINENQPTQQNFTVNNSDIISQFNGIITYEKEITVPRLSNQSGYNCTIRNLGGQYEDTSVFSASTLLAIWNIGEIDINTSVDGTATITIPTVIQTQTKPLGFEYSINGVDYVNTNVITSIPAGDYTVHVRDIYGCEKTKDIEILDIPEQTINPINTFSHVSLLNSVPFTKINDDPSNFDNTPSYAVDAETLYSDMIYQYKANDVLRFQFRSNYDVNKVYLLDCGVVQQELFVTEVQNNLNQKDIRQMRSTFENGELYLFNDGTGNVYAQDGTTVIGTNELNGVLLNSQNEGDVIELENIGLVQILGITELEPNVFALRLNYNQSIADPYVKVTSFINQNTVNFNVYEFSYGMYTLPNNDKRYQIVIINRPFSYFDGLIDAGIFIDGQGLFIDDELVMFPNDIINPLTDATYISEVFTTFQDKPLHKFVWKNSENNQFNWDTGIECLTYLPKLFDPTFQPEDENEIYTTDTSHFMLESDVKETYTFHFDVLSLMQFRHLNFILSNDYLKIDGVFYVKEETPEGEALIGSNGYDVKAKLSVSSNYNSNERYL